MAQWNKDTRLYGRTKTRSQSSHFRLSLEIRNQFGKTRKHRWRRFYNVLLILLRSDIDVAGRSDDEAFGHHPSESWSDWVRRVIFRLYGNLRLRTFIEQLQMASVRFSEYLAVIYISMVKTAHQTLPRDAQMFIAKYNGPIMLAEREREREREREVILLRRSIYYKA